MEQNNKTMLGTRDVYAGETLSSEEIKSFESFKSNAEPVMTVSVEAKKTADLPKLIEVIRQITEEDPNIVAVVNQDTGEHLLSGMGELHLDVTRHRIESDHNVPIEVGQPSVHGEKRQLVNDRSGGEESVRGIAVRKLELSTLQGDLEVERRLLNGKRVAGPLYPTSRLAVKLHASLRIQHTEFPD